MEVGFTLMIARGLSRAAPIVEAGLGLLLIFGLATHATHWFALLSAASFVVLQSRAWRRDSDKPCHCFGQFDRGYSQRVAFVRSVVFATLCISLSTLILVSPDAGEGDFAAFAVGVSVGIVLILIFTLADEIVGFELRRPRALRPDDQGRHGSPTQWRPHVGSTPG